MDAKQIYFDILKACIETMQATLDSARCSLKSLNDLVDNPENAANHDLMDNQLESIAVDLNSENMIVKTEEPIEASKPSMEAPMEIPEPPKEIPEPPKVYPFYKPAPPLVRCKEYDEDSKRVRRQLLTPSFLERLPTFAGIVLATVEEKMEWQRSCEAFRFTGKRKAETLHDLSELVYFVWLWHKEDRIKIHDLCSELSKRITILIDALNENWEKKKEEHDYESDEDEDEDEDEAEDITDDSEEEEEDEDGDVDDDDEEYTVTPLRKKSKHEH